MSSLQAAIQRAYILSDEEQSVLVQLIDKFIAGARNKTSTAKNRRAGKYDGKFMVIDDIDFCNDEIAEMFGADSE